MLQKLAWQKSSYTGTRNQERAREMALWGSACRASMRMLVHISRTQVFRAAHIYNPRGGANEKENKEKEQEEELEQKAQGKEGEDKERRQRTPGAQWLSNLDKLMRSRVSERLCQKTRCVASEEDHRHCPLACTCMHRCIYVLYMSTHNQTTLTHTCTPI